jgi:hypothetical protein
MRKPKLKTRIEDIYNKGQLENYLREQNIEMNVFNNDLRIGYKEDGKHVLIYYINLEDNCIEIIYATKDSLDNLDIDYLLTLYNNPHFYYYFEMPL